MKKIEGGITAAKGFQAAGGAAGIKKQGSKGYGTCLQRGTVRSSRNLYYKHRKSSSGQMGPGDCIQPSNRTGNRLQQRNCQCMHRREGYGYCRKTAEAASAALSIPEDSVLVASTGVIGKQIPIDKIAAGVEMLKPQLAATREAAATAAQAIMTTDTEPKEVAVQIEIGGKTVTTAACARAPGMIHPNMCTMLSFVATDANISKEMLQKALSEVVPDTYNMVSVDGDTSTNDTVLLLANGLAGNPEITEENEDYKIFKEALFEVNKTQAMHIAGDGEGATALFEVTIQGAESKEQAVTLAKSVITSSLTKAAIFGHDANWGRILCAMGYSGAKFDPENVDLYFESAAGKLQIITKGVAVDYSEEEATKILSEPKVTATADIHMGEATATAWGCDLTYDYVKINADYRS